MAPQSRTVKTLSILAASMTGATLLLSALEPLPPRSVGSARVEEVRASVLAAVATAGPIGNDRWNGIEVCLEREIDAFGGYALAAVRDPAEYHFRIELSGSVRAARAWHVQDPDLTGGAIRIVLAGSARSHAAADGQNTALRLLVNTLCAACRSGDSGVADSCGVVLSDGVQRSAHLTLAFPPDGRLG